MSDRPFDIVAYGATGFTGRQVAAWLAEHAPEGVRWTIAGRRADALADVAREVGLEAEPIVADSSDQASVDAMAARTRVVITTAGPFARYGTPVVQACVRNKTHYCDITGESPWVAGLIEQFHEQAQKDGTRIVPFCGFDSVPSDLGTWFVVRALQDRSDSPVTSVRAAFKIHGGGLNGGTLASALNLMEHFEPKQLADPFLLTPGRTPREVWSANADPRGPVHDPHRDRWMMPFFMGPVNTRVVRRSAWLFGERGAPYGEAFTYQEYMDVSRGSRFVARRNTLAMGAAMAAASHPWGRSLLRRVGPSPGQGPSAEAMDKGGFRVHYRGENLAGEAVVAEMRSPGDAGNRSTVRFLCNAALTLALDGENLGFAPGNGGVLSPAVALGASYLGRLREYGVQLGEVIG